MNDHFVFWDGEGKISPSLLYEFLSRNGFGKYFPSGVKKKCTEPVIVRLNRNIVSEVNISYIISIVHENIITCTVGNGESGPILDSLHRSTSLFGPKNIMLLPTLELEFISDTRNSGYAFFKNGVVVIEENSILLREYDDFDAFVWENSIININFQPIDNEPLQNFDFFQFLLDLSQVDSEENTISRFGSLKSLIGYLMHRFKDGNTTKAIILMDVYKNGSPNGGSGKSLLINAIGKIRNLATIDGKKYDQREWFGLSSVGIGTEVLSFDDIKKDFDLEQLFPLITEGLYQRRKYKDHLFIQHKDSPKIALTTNYAINGDSDSFKRRMFEFEVSATYNAEFSPRDKFRRNFFDEWSDSDWNCFFNTMFLCLQFYLANGLVRSEPINIGLTKMISRTSEDFVEWADDHITLGSHLDKKELYESFLELYPDYKILKQRSFTDWLKAWGKYKNLIIGEHHSGDSRYITFTVIN